MKKSKDGKKKTEPKFINSIDNIITYVNKNKNNLAFVPQLKEYDRTVSCMLEDFEGIKEFDFETELNEIESMLDKNDIQLEKVKNLLVNNLSDYLR